MQRIGIANPDKWKTDRHFLRTNDRGGALPVTLPAMLAMLIAMLPLPGFCADINLVFRHGEPIQDREAAWDGRIEFASWIDDEHIVYSSRGDVTCISTTSGDVQWTVQNEGRIADWSISRPTGRLAILSTRDTMSLLEKEISVIDCRNGNPIFTADANQMAKLLGLDFVLLSRIAMVPATGRLVLCSSSTFYGRNAYVLDPPYTKPASSFDIDAFPSELSMSPDGHRVATVADKDVLCVRDLIENRDIFFRGTRIKEKPNGVVVTIDTPFFSHIRDSGGHHLVYTRDNSWDTGMVFVHNLKTGKVNSFDARNGHIELDVSFTARRLVLTGTSTNVTVLDFEGNVIAHKQNATLQRNSCVEFAPSGNRLLVASWDNTLSVFSICENGK